MNLRSSSVAALCAAAALSQVAAAAEAQFEPKLGPKFQDADTRAWWRLTAQLSDDAMEGRDTGSPAYARAAKIVADRFAAAGLKPAGDPGSFFQWPRRSTPRRPPISTASSMS